MRIVMPVGLVGLIGLVAAAMLFRVRLAGAEPLRLTVSDSYRLARRHSFELKRQQAEQDAAVARQHQARGSLFPAVKLSSLFSRVQEVPPGRIPLPPELGVENPTFGDAISSITTLRAQATQLLFDGLGAQHQLMAARLGVDVAREQKHGADLDLRLAVEQAYFGTYLANELEKVAAHAVEVVGAHLASIRTLYAAGRATDLDLAHAEAQLADAEASREEAREQLADSRAVLLMLLGLPARTELELAEPPDDRVAAPSALAELALANRPELAIARVAARAEREQVGVARAGYYPRLSLEAGYTYANPNQRFIPPVSEFNGTWDVGIVGVWTFDWGITRARVAEATSNARAAEYRVAALEDQTRADATSLEATIAATARRIDASRAAVEAAERAFAAAQRTFELGRLESTVLLDRELDLRRARARLLQALVDHRLARARARRLIGAAP